VGPRKHGLLGDPDPHVKGHILRGKGLPIVWYTDFVVSCAKMAELIKMLFGIWTPVVQGNMY